jgi:hypothetical protein
VLPRVTVVVPGGTERASLVVERVRQAIKESTMGHLSG